MAVEETKLKFSKVHYKPKRLKRNFHVIKNINKNKNKILLTKVKKRSHH